MLCIFTKLCLSYMWYKCLFCFSLSLFNNVFLQRIKKSKKDNCHVLNWFHKNALSFIGVRCWWNVVCIHMMCILEYESSIPHTETLAYWAVGENILFTRAGTIQSLSVHYRYRNQPIRIDTVIVLYRYRCMMVTASQKHDYFGPKTIHFTLNFHTLGKRLVHIEFDSNYVELILCE